MAVRHIIQYHSAPRSISSLISRSAFRAAADKKKAKVKKDGKDSERREEDIEIDEDEEDDKDDKDDDFDDE